MSKTSDWDVFRIMIFHTSGIVMKHLNYNILLDDDEKRHERKQSNSFKIYEKGGTTHKRNEKKHLNHQTEIQSEILDIKEYGHVNDQSGDKNEAFESITQVIDSQR